MNTKVSYNVHRTCVLSVLLVALFVQFVDPMPIHRVALQSLTGEHMEIGKRKWFEGDIRLEIDDKPYGHRKKRSDIMTSSGQEAEIMETPEYSHIWPNRTVYYTFETGLDEMYRAIWDDAIQEWSQHTCISFEVAKSAEATPDHLVFKKDDDFGCSSFVGKKGGPQLVTMSEFCNSRGHAIHEIGHALGLWHEHSRPDRDTYIDVLYDNIIETETDNFGRLIPEKFDLVPDVGYDIESIMHYGPHAFSKWDGGSPRETIRLRDDAPLDYKHCTNLLSMGQRDELSYLDKLRANKLYSCNAQVTKLEAEGRECLTLVTTPTPTTTEQATTMPDPTPVSPTTPTPSPPKRLQSGSIITLRLVDPSKSFEDLDSLRCTPTCRSTNCVVWGSKSSCDRIDHRFEVVVPEDPDAKKIKGGAKVALRSRSNPTQWLDCSSADGACSLSRCTSNSVDAANASITNCDSHFFKIFGVGRRRTKLINSNHSIQLRHEYNDSYLNCNTGDKCKLSDCAENCESQAFMFKFNVIS